MSRVNPDQNQDEGQNDQEQTFNSDEGQQSTGGGGWVLDGPDDLDDTFVPPVTGAQPPAGTVPTQGQPGQQYELRTKTGFVFRGATPEEALEQAQAHYDKINLALGTSTSEYEGQHQQQQTIPPQQRQQEAPDARWNDEEFFKTFAKDPHAAMGMFIESYFGDDPRQALSRSYSVAVQVSDRIAIADFLAANNDFPASPEAGALIIKKLEADGVDLTATNLEVAFRKLVREGVLAPIQVQQETTNQNQNQNQGRQQTQQDTTIQPVRGRGAPPNIPRQQQSTGGDGTQIGDREISLSEFENLSAPDMRRYMQRRAQLTGRR